MCTIQRNILDARRWLCLFLVCCFVLCGIGGIHQRAQAIVGVSTAAIAVIIAGLAAIGITFVSTGAYNSLSDYVGSLIEQYAADNSVTPGTLFTGTQSGVNSAGQLLLNNRYVQLIQGFATWLKIKYNLTNNSTVALQTPGVTMGDIALYALPLTLTSVYGEEMSYTIISGDGYAACVYNSSAHTTFSVRVMTELSTTVNYMYIYNGRTTTSTKYSNTLTSSGYYISGAIGNSFSPANIEQSITPCTNEQFMDVVNGDNVIDENNIGIDIDTGAISLPSDNPDYATGDGAVVDVAAPWGSTLPQVTDGVIPGLWTAGNSGNPSIAYDSTPAIQDQINAEGSQVINQDPNSYQVPGLQSVFPFCIPFDIYNLLSALAADPVAPSFTWRFYVPRVCDETFTVDLSPFDTVAQVVRTVELLAFIVGLAMVTRERFLRG